MAEKRTVRSPEERKAELEKKLQYHKNCIEVLEKKLDAVDNPKKSAGRSKGLKRILTENKISDEAVASALGFKNAAEMKEAVLNAIEKK